MAKRQKNTMEKRHFAVGQTWERDGEQREIHELRRFSDDSKIECVTGLDKFSLIWKRPGGKPQPTCLWCSTWLDWASGARLVSVNGTPVSRGNSEG